MSRGAGTSLLDWSPKATADFCGFVKCFFAVFSKKFLHNMQKHVRDAKKKTFDHLWIKGLEFRKDIYEKSEDRI